MQEIALLVGLGSQREVRVKEGRLENQVDMRFANGTQDRASVKLGKLV